MKPIATVLSLATLLHCASLALPAAPLGTAFTYQGRLHDAAQPASGIYDLRFAIYDALSGGSAIGRSLTNAATPVTNGLFTVPLDFGAAVFDGNARWLAIEVRTNGGGDFVPLSPRQALTPTPQALFASQAAAAASATTASTANGVAPGSVGAAGLAPNAVDSSRIADDSVGVSDLNSTVLSNTFWRLSGNLSTTPGTHFLGTADNQPFELKVNGQRALRLEPTVANEPNIVGGLSANYVANDVAGATIAGGGQAGGWQNTVGVGANYGTVGGGRANAVTAQEGTVVGGAQNRATGEKSFVGGGFNNQAGAFASAVGGGWNNQVSSQYSTLGGGIGNAINNGTATVAGGSYNTNSGSGGAIGGGDNNRVTAATATVPGGQRNTASGISSLAAGKDSTASGASAVAVGFTNRASGDYSVSLGSRNTASGLASTALGDQNLAAGMYSTALGYYNRATGIYSAALNYNTDAGGFGSHAAGTQAKAIHDGTFVWADHAYQDFASTRSNQFLIRASGGVGIGTNHPQAALHVAGSVRADGFSGSGAGLTTLNGAALNDGSITSAKFAPGAVNHLDAPDGSPTSAVLVNTNGLVGIGTTTPQAGLDIRTTNTVLVPKVLFEVGDDTAPYTNLYWASSVSVSGNLCALGANGSPGSVTLIDISNPQAPVWRSQIFDGLGTFTNLYKVESVALVSNLLVVPAEFDNAVTLVSVANPANPVKLAELRDGVGGWNSLQGPSAVAISGNLLAIAARDDQAVTLADISNPAAPLQRAVISMGTNGITFKPWCRPLALHGNLLAVAGSNAVTLLDVSNPASPVQRAKLVQGTGAFTNLALPISVALSANLLAVSEDGNGVTIVDVSNPSAPVWRALLREGVDGAGVFRSPHGLAFSGSRLAIGADLGVMWFDLTQPAQPRLLAQIRQKQGGAHLLLSTTDVAFAGTNLAAASLSRGAFTLLGFELEGASLFSEGWVGIGTRQPLAPLHVVGDVVVEQADRFNVVATHVEMGMGSSSSGLYSVALGHEAEAIGHNSIAIGTDAKAGDTFATAIGRYSQALGSEATALGSGYASGYRSIAIGDGLATGWSALSLGDATASGSNAVAIGYGNQASGAHSTALGTWSVASGRNAVALGYAATSSGENAVALGGGNTSSGRSSLAAGHWANATNDGAFVWADLVNVPFTSTASNQFLVRAGGGVGINTNNPQAALHVAGTVKADAFVGTGSAPASFPGLGIGTPSPEDSALDVEGNIHLNNYDLFLREGADRNHGLGWYGASKLFGGVNVDGPVLYGCAGGGLGTMCNTQQLALRWDNTGRLTVDPGNANNGTLTPGLTFGLTSGEGIASKRTAGGNQYGLDFYTSFQNRMTILNSGFIGVGTANPTHLFHLHSASSNTMRLTSTGANGAGAKINFGDAEYVYLQEVSDDVLRIQATRMGIGRTPAANRFEVEGEASKTTAGSWLANSDARIKTDIAAVTNALETLARVRPVSFRYTDEYRAAHPSIEDQSYVNVVAQEFQHVFPDAVKSSGERLPDGSEILQVDTYPLTIYSAAAIQELNRKLEQRLHAQESELRALKERVENLEKLVSRLTERP